MPAESIKPCRKGHPRKRQPSGRLECPTCRKARQLSYLHGKGVQPRKKAPRRECCQDAPKQCPQCRQCPQATITVRVRKTVKPYRDPVCDLVVTMITHGLTTDDLSINMADNGDLLMRVAKLWQTDPQPSGVSELVTRKYATEQDWTLAGGRSRTLDSVRDAA